jgi:hypothetical protein
VADLDTRSKRASSVGMLLGFFAAPPLPDGTLGQGDRQHVGWSYSGILASVTAALEFIGDINSRVYRYLCDYYSVSSGDLTSMATKYMATLSGDMNQRWHRLVQDATDAMT